MAAPASAVGSAAAADSAGHYGGQLAGGMDGAVGDDAAGDGPAAAFLAVAINEVGQFVGIRRVDQVGGGGAGGVVAQIQGLVGLERKAVAGLVNLAGGKAQVQ